MYFLGSVDRRAGPVEDRILRLVADSHETGSLASVLEGVRHHQPDRLAVVAHPVVLKQRRYAHRQRATRRGTLRALPLPLATLRAAALRGAGVLGGRVGPGLWRSRKPRR